MSKAKFDAAKELIDEKRYDEARVLLKTIDHPAAAKWLDKLDAIAPMNGVAKNSKSPTVKTKKKPTRLQIFLLVAFAIIFGILVISAMQTAQLQRQNIEAINQAYK